MTIHEFGKENDKVMLLIHPSAVMWDYFEYVIPLLEKKYHLIVPALPGYDTLTGEDYTSVEDIADRLADWLIAHGHGEIECIYGCSMGGAIVLRILAERRIKAKNAVIDGGVTPYQLPWLVTRAIAVKDFLLIYAGKLGGMKLLQKAFASDEYTGDDLKYIVDVLHMMSAKTVWRTFESCNNFSMPEVIDASDVNMEYWFAEKEIGERKADMAYVRKHFPHCRFRRFHDIGHGGLAVCKPELFVKGITLICEGLGQGKG
ncbi:MAG: alpha/beta hydrolase [Ruminococcus sp.]|nr:alpha/beta hydrolase [Ruminococcus sp.]